MNDDGKFDFPAWAGYEVLEHEYPDVYDVPQEFDDYLAKVAEYGSL